MRIVGKCPPESEELAAAHERGFDKVELYLEKWHLDELQRTREAVRNASVDVVSVHTPHVHPSDKGYVLLADKLVKDLDAFLVFHSQYTHHTHIPILEKLSLESPYGYENNPGASMKYISNCILEKGHRLVLDTAHYYLAHGNDYSLMQSLLHEHKDQIPVIHLNDATPIEDGLAFGEGEMDLEKVSNIIGDAGFEGILVLEVMPENQEEARKQFTSFTE